MPERTEHSYPPVGDPTRLDAIVQRGRSLRRRRHLATGAGAGGAMAAAVVAVVLFTGATGGDADGSLIADDPPTTTAAPAATTEPVLAEMQVDIAIASSPVQVLVQDPARPVALPTEPPAQQCVQVTLHDSAGLAAAEGRACNFGGDEPVAVEVLRPFEQTQIGCAAAVVRVDPVERTTGPAASTFQLALPRDLPAGAYDLSVEAVSGIGDGCAPASDGEAENVAAASASLTIP